MLCPAVAEPTRSRTRRSVVVVVILTGVLAALWLGHVRARRTALQRFANLSACLLGQPLREGETPWERVRAIRHARPFEKKTVDASGKRLVPKDPMPPDQAWPGRCLPMARELAQAVALRWLAPRASERARALVHELEIGELREDIDALWLESGLDDPNVVPDASVPRPWAPATLLDQDALFDVGAACPPFVLDATIDAWRRDRLTLAGKPGCSIGPDGNGRPLSRLRFEETRTEKEKGADVLRGARSATVLGRALSIEKQVATLASPGDGGPVELGRADAFSSCNAGSSRVVLLTSREPAALDVRFVDAKGVSPPARVELAPPSFPGHGKTVVGRGRVILNCREGEASVGFAWSTAVDQEHWHEITIVRCTPGRCRSSRARLSIPMLWSQGCGYCDPDPVPYSVESPLVIDLFDAVALVWSTGGTERARVAPLERLADTPDVVLWEKPDGSHDEHEGVRARGLVAVLGVSVTSPARRHLFRLDASGVSVLAPE